MAALDRGKGLAKGFFWGGLIGLVVGILLATKREKVTWEDIGKSADALVDKTKEQMGQARRKMEELANRGKDSSAGEQESLTKNI
jgi:gas vesicle protein